MATTGIYTGRGLATQLPTDSGKSMSRLSDFITRAEELKYQTFKQNEQEFLKNSNIDPKYFISTAHQGVQMKLLKEHNDKWGSRMKETNNNLSIEDKQQMLAEKNFIIAQQQDMEAKQKAWEMEDALVKKNPADFDDKEHALKTMKFINEGEFDYNTLPYRAKSISEDLIKLRGKIGATTTTTAPMKDAAGFQQTIKTTGTREDVAPIIVDAVFSDPRYMKDMMQKWKDLPQADKDRYLDTDGVAGVSEEERAKGEAPAKSSENPILKFYIDQNYKYGIQEEPSTPQRITTGTAKAPTGTSGIVAKKRDIDPKYGNISRPNIYSLGGDVAITDIPTTGAKLLDDTGSYNYDLKGNPAKAYLKDYDADRNTVIVQVTARDPSSFIETKQLVEVPIKNIIEQVKDIKIVVDGKTTTIGAMEGTVKPSTDKMSLPEWRKANAGLPLSEYQKYVNAR